MGRSRSRSRDRDRKKKKKYRSRSEESADRSREREKRRRRQQREFMQKYGGKGGGKGGGRDQKEGGMFWDGFQWIPVGAENKKKEDAASRKARRLYLGNLPIAAGLTEKTFGMELVKAMKDVGIADPSQADEEILDRLNIWFAKDHNYGFLECKSQEEAERILVKLSGMLVMGEPVEIKRPNDHGVMQNGMPGAAMGGKGAAPLALNAPVQCTTRILEIKEALKYDKNNHDEELFQETFEDMNDGCSQHGKINGGKIIHPKHMPNLQANPDVEIGTVYLEFTSVNDASAAMQKMANRKYDGRFLKFQSFPEDKYFNVVAPLQ